MRSGARQLLLCCRCMQRQTSIGFFHKQLCVPIQLCPTCLIDACCSYDDFYLEASVACGSASSAAAGAALAGGGSPGEQQPWRQHAQLHQQPPDRLLFLSGASKQEAQQQQQQQWEALPADLRRGVALAAALRAAAKQQLGITLSVGIARNKLLARLASPCGKPDGLAVVPDAAAVAFICHFPLQKVPLLR